MSQKYIKSQNKNSHNAKSYGKYYATAVYDNAMNAEPEDEDETDTGSESGNGGSQSQGGSQNGGDGGDGGDGLTND